MGKNLRKKAIVVGIILLFCGVNIVSGMTPGIRTSHQHRISSDIKTQDVEKTVPITLLIYGTTRRNPQTQQLSIQEADKIFEVFKELKIAITTYPFDEHTQQLKEEFIALLAYYQLIPSNIPPEQYMTLLNPPWFENLQKNHNTRTTSSEIISEGPGTAAALFCSLAGNGVGVLFPFIMLPRPRVITGWSTLDGNTIVGRLLTIGGFIGNGAQFGIALGFWGIGLAYATPYGTIYGFIGYSLFAGVTAGSIERFPPDYAPVILTTNPPDKARDVPTSLTELQFSIEDPSGDLMAYEVTTYPDIGSGNANLKPAGTYSIPVQGLDGLTEYYWTLRVSDDVQTIEQTFTFTTEAVAPILSDPSPENEERDVPMNLPFLQFTVKDYQGDEMEFTVETSPNIGSRHEIGIHDGSYTVPISGMEYAAWYHWYVNITDGTHWTRKIYSFSTGYPSPFDPFDYGWQYRKQIIIDHTKVIGDQTEFPVLISVSDMDLIKTQQNGDDLLFMNGSGASIKLRHEIETFNQATGSLTAWVNIPVLSSTQDTVVYLYYGNPDCINQEYPEKTWDPHYKAVWHMNDDTSSTITDSTINQNDGVKTEVNGPIQSTGKIGFGQVFDGNNDYINCGHDQSLSQTGILTIESWINYNGVSNPLYPPDAIGKSTTKTGYAIQVDTASGTFLRAGTGAWYDSPRYPQTTGAWYHAVGVYDGTFLHLYINGVELSPATSYTKGFTANSADALMGKHYDNNGYLNGFLDEIRISNIVRSNTWILTEYENSNNPEDFLSLGPEEPHP